MIDGLRAEFPSATRWVAGLQRPAVAREPVGWAFLSAAGAGFVVGGIVGLVLLTAAPVLFSATEPRPTWFTYPVITRAAASLAIGAVALRSGGVAALALYVLYELALIVAAFPGRQRSCAFVDSAHPQTCDILGLVVDHWPMWLALALGAIGSRWLFRAGGQHGANRLLRGAGTFAVVVTIATTLYGVLTYATISSRESSLEFVLMAIYVLGQLVGGILAGMILGRSRSAAALLMGLLVISGLAATLPNIRANWIPNMPLEMLFLSYSGVFAPLVGAIGIALGWTVRRRQTM